ncbi:MAG: hypothetical protein IT450_13580 [Phycisphaerales bacterium]|nr:hypothetical protein [Phycisphaerales bacterium]
MTVLNGHFDGQRIVLDDPVPSTVRPQTPVRVLIEDEPVDGGDATRSVLDAIADLAVDDPNLPTDFSEQHDHYVRGTPRK